MRAPGMRHGAHRSVMIFRPLIALYGLRPAAARWLLATAAGLPALFLVLSLCFPLPPLKPYSLLVLDRNGGYLSAFLASDGIWRLRTPPGEIPERLKTILIEKEDRFFLYHPGINPFSIVRAAAGNLLSGERRSGGSTLTMQIARMLEPKERTYAGKLVEVFRALQLEWRYSKDELLELYLSMVPVGGNIEGLKSASLLYYRTPLDRLDIAHLLDLILLPNNPNGFRPDRHPDRLYDERVRRGMDWVKRGILTQQDAAIILQTPAQAERHAPPTRAPHFALRIKGMKPATPEVRTTLNPGIQSTTERLLAEHLQSWVDRGVRNGAALVLANHTNEVLGYAGSADFGDPLAHGQVDGIRALRSPGSTLKPFLYALCMERGDLTPKSRLLDTPYDLEGFGAENYDGTYSGLVFADEALRRSLNVPMIRLLRSTGVPPFIDFLERTGMASLGPQRARFGLSVILGGCGVTLEELTGAYASFPNGGISLPPGYLLSRDGEHRTGIQAFSPPTAFMVTEILAGLDRPDLPNNFESASRLPAIAFKTGTSYGRRDAWAIGYTSEYTVGVWTGNADNRGSADLVGSKAAAPLLIDILNAISSSHHKTILNPPRGLDVRAVCSNSGLLPTPLCTQTVMDYYEPGRSHTRQCTVDREYLVSTDRSFQYCPSCLGTNAYRSVVMADYPAELVSFWYSNGLSVPAPPPHNPSCPRVFAGDGPRIVSPSEAMTYYILDPRQKLALEADSPPDVRRHAWYIDEKFYARKSPREKLFVGLASGPHVVTCVDDRGRTSRVQFEITCP